MFLSIATASDLLSQTSIQAPSARIDRAKTYNLPVIGTLPAGQITDIKLLFKYNANIIDIKSATGKNNYAIQDSSPIYSNDYTNLDETLFTVVGTKVQNKTDDTLCMLQIEGLAYSDSICILKPFQMWVNNAYIANTELKDGKIIVNGSSILPNFPDNFNYGYPNPFDYKIKFDFNLEKNSAIEFKVFNLNGTRAVDSRNDPQMFAIADEISGKIYNDLNQVFAKGSYTLQFTPDATVIAGGLYIIVFKTDRSVYNRNFIYIK